MPASEQSDRQRRKTKPRPPKRDIGVLFVHGVGLQPEGDTLLAFGEPLIRWADRWLHRPSTDAAAGSFEISSTRLTPSRTGDAFPPHATAKLSVKKDGKERTSSWLLAESWWGGDVQPPPFGRFASWLLTIGAWTAVAHMTKWARRHENKMARVTVELLMTIVGLLLAMLLQLGVLAMSILAVLPIPALRRALSKALVAMTGVLGDCFVLVESDLQRAAIVTRTRAALRWLARRCERVVVIAHSQGAAVAHYALRPSTPANVELLVTLGSGLGKLSELEHAGKTIGRVRSMASMAPLTGLVLCLLAYITLFERRDDLSNLTLYMMAFLAFALIVGVFYMARVHWENAGKRALELSLLGSRKGLRWVDIYAARDPVPNGEMLPGGVKVPGVTSHSVVNLGSMVGDHTSYWQNRCEFVPLVLRELSATLGLELFREKDRRELNALARRHRHNVWWLKASRWAALLSVGLMFWLYGDALHARGIELAPLLSGVGSPLETLASRVKDGLMFALRLVFRGNATPVGLELLGAAVPLLVIALWQYAHRFLWRWWDGVALEAVFKPGSIGRADQRILTGALIVFGLAPLSLVLGWPIVSGIQVSHLIGGTVIGVFSALSLVALFGFGRTGLALVPKSLKGDPEARTKLKEALSAGGAVVLVLALFLWAAVPAVEPYRDYGIYLITIGAVVFVFMRIQIGYVRRVRARFQANAVAWSLIVAPAVAALVAATILLAKLGPQNEGGLPPYMGFLISLIVLYVFAIGIAYGLLRVFTRRADAV